MIIIKYYLLILVLPSLTTVHCKYDLKLKTINISKIKLVFYFYIPLWPIVNKNMNTQRISLTKFKVIKYTTSTDIMTNLQ